MSIQSFLHCSRLAIALWPSHTRESCYGLNRTSRAGRLACPLQTSLTCTYCSARQGPFLVTIIVSPRYVSLYSVIIHFWAKRIMMSIRCKGDLHYEPTYDSGPLRRVLYLLHAGCIAWSPCSGGIWWPSSSHLLFFLFFGSSCPGSLTGGISPGVSSRVPW